MTRVRHLDPGLAWARTAGACLALLALLSPAVRAAPTATPELSDLVLTGETTRYVLVNPPSSAGAGQALSIKGGQANGANSGGDVIIGGGYSSVTFGDVLLSTAGGKVGIGTDTPAHTLDVKGSMYTRRYTLTDAATIAVDWNNGNTQSVVIGGVGRTVTFANGQDGGKYTLIVKEDGTGSRTITTWPASVRWPSGYAHTLTTTANKTDYFGFIYNGVDAKYDCVAFRSNL